MALKRHFSNDGEEEEEDGMGGGAHQEAKRFKKVLTEVLGMLTTSDFVSKLELLLRPVVRDAAERAVLHALQPSSRASFNQTRARTSRGSGWILHFVNRLPSTIFTGSRIEGEDGQLIRIALMDAKSKSVVRSGPLSSLKVDIVVLDGDFGFDENEDWSQKEFEANVIREREGRRPLVTGELTISLKDGVGQIRDAMITDNSSWQRSRKFRIGAKVQRASDEIRVREGRSEAFVVKDHRGELYKKHYPPRLDDHIWRLEKIAKDGKFHRRLTLNGVSTVRDFLQLCSVNPSKLRNVLGCGISNRIWDTIMEHAASCVLDDGNLCSYYDSAVGVQLFFNSVYKLVGVTFDGQNFLSLHKLSPAQKALVESSKRQAYENVKEFIPVDVGAGPSRLFTSIQEEPYQGPNLTLQQREFPADNQDRSDLQLDVNTSSCSTSVGYEYEPESSSQMEGEAMGFFYPMNSFKFPDVPFSYTGDWSPNGWPVGTSGQLTADEGVSVIQASTWCPSHSTWEQGNLFMFPAGDEGDLGLFSSVPNLGVHMTRNGKPRAGWCKLRAALIWKSLRRDVANKRLWQGFYVD